MILSFEKSENWFRNLFLGSDAQRIECVEKLVSNAQISLQSFNIKIISVIFRTFNFQYFTTDSFLQCSWSSKFHKYSNICSSDLDSILMLETNALLRINHVNRRNHGIREGKLPKCSPSSCSWGSVSVTSGALMTGGSNGTKISSSPGTTSFSL